jgi:hypothetical protein
LEEIDMVLRFQGTWRLSVVRVIADWPQRVIVSGSVDGVIPGRVGESRTISGGDWQLRFECNPGTGWQPDCRVMVGEPERTGNRVAQLIRCKDVDWRGDKTPNDLVLLLDADRYAVRIQSPSATQLPGRRAETVDNVLRKRGEWVIGVDVTNTGPEPLAYDMLLDLSDATRAALQARGVRVNEAASRVLQDQYGQETDVSGAVRLPPLRNGATTRVHFLADSAGAGGILPDLEFVLSRGDSWGGESVVSRASCESDRARPAAADPWQVEAPAALRGAQVPGERSFPERAYHRPATYGEGSQPR